MNNLKLGQKVKFQKEVLKRRKYECDPGETEALKNSLGLKKHRMNWNVRVNKKVQEGIICGIRHVDLNGAFDNSDGYYEFGKPLRVYLVATGMSGFHRVPEQFLITDASST